MAKKVIKIITNLFLCILLTIMCLGISAVILTIFREGIKVAIYLVEFSIMIPSFMLGLKSKNFKYSIINSVLYSITLIGLLFLNVGQIKFSKEIFYLIIMIIISHVLGTLARSKNKVVG